jgi:hypothetical protein
LKLNLTADVGIQKSDEKHYKGENSGAEWLTSYCQMIAEELNIKEGLTVWLILMEILVMKKDCKIGTHEPQ